MFLDIFDEAITAISFIIFISLFLIYHVAYKKVVKHLSKPDIFTIISLIIFGICAINLTNALGNQADYVNSVHEDVESQNTKVKLRQEIKSYQHKLSYNKHQIHLFDNEYQRNPTESHVQTDKLLNQGQMHPKQIKQARYYKQQIRWLETYYKNEVSFRSISCLNVADYRNRFDVKHSNIKKVEHHYVEHHLKTGKKRFYAKIN